MRTESIIVALLLLACSENDSAGADGSASNTSSGGSTGNVTSGTVNNESSAGGSNSGATSSTTGEAGSGIIGVPGDPGCGLDAAAFCDTFDSISNSNGRAGDIDSAFWSASRGSPQLPSANGLALPVGPATLPQCRSGLPAKVFPTEDTLVCDPTELIQSNHLLVAVGAQNYGQNSYRIRQPFDFSGRTGHIVLDMEGYMYSLIGFLSLAVTEDPTPIPSYSIGSEGQNNSEGGATPRSAFLVRFINCPANDAVGVDFIDVLDNYQDTVYHADPVECAPALQGALNHIELTVSQDRVEVYATPYSETGQEFGDAVLLLGADVDLPFTRGYVQLTVHNHASIKYSQDRLGVFYDAWFARFDNVGFDGPVLDDWRESEAPPSLIPGEAATSIDGDVVSVGYRVADVEDGPNDIIPLPDVDPSGATIARVALAAWYSLSGEVSRYNLRFRVNGGTWHDRPLTAGEVALLTGGHSHGALSQILEVPVEELVAGDNTIEFVSENIPQSYPPVVSAIDLIVSHD